MQLSFHGAVRGVTGSCFLLETKESKLLVDCGMFQGERMNAPENLAELGFDPADVDAVIVTHAHYDHTGRLPLLAKNGFTGKIYMTPPTKALSRLILEDAQRVMAENAKRNGDPVLYAPEDVEKADDLVTTMNYHTQFEVVPGVHAMFHDAGHILGSAFISLTFDGRHMKDGEKKTIVFSGDLGNDQIPILPDTEAIHEADIVVTESTYGNRDHEPVASRHGKLKDAVTKVIDRGGTLIIPAFSIERTQELLYELDGLIDAKELPDVPIYLDSPLAIRATEVYRHFHSYLRFDRSILTSPDRDFFSFPRLKVTLNSEDSKSINSHQGPKVIIAGSGMMTGGRVLHHLKRYLEDKRSGVLILGYPGVGTLGRKIQDGVEQVRIHEEPLQVRAEIMTIHSFSAHADRKKIRDWVKPEQGSVEKIFLTHGDHEVKPEFAEFLKQEVEADVVIPQYWQSFGL
jgi:metallo-beta-lactamase family protein